MKSSVSHKHQVMSFSNGYRKLEGRGESRYIPINLNREEVIDLLIPISHAYIDFGSRIDLGSPISRPSYSCLQCTSCFPSWVQGQGMFFETCYYSYNVSSSNWTEWSTIQGVIVRVISKSDECAVRDQFEMRSTITP